MNQFTILHNPRCSKSRQTLTLLEQNNIKPEVRLYLQNPLNKVELKNLSQSLNKNPIEFMRSNEEIFKHLNLNKNSPDEDLINAIAENPILLERPIVIKDNKYAVIGRPPENVLALLN